jgi:hypothetical protein
VKGFWDFWFPIIFTGTVAYLVAMSFCPTAKAAQDDFVLDVQNWTEATAMYWNGSDWAPREVLVPMIDDAVVVLCFGAEHERVIRCFYRGVPGGGVSEVEVAIKAVPT